MSPAGLNVLKCTGMYVNLNAHWKKTQPSCLCSRDLNWTGKGLRAPRKTTPQKIKLLYFTISLRLWCILGNMLMGPKEEEENFFKIFKFCASLSCKIPVSLESVPSKKSSGRWCIWPFSKMQQKTSFELNVCVLYWALQQLLIVQSEGDNDLKTWKQE
jgi:hypothetical protein